MSQKTVQERIRELEARQQSLKDELVCVTMELFILKYPSKGSPSELQKAIYEVLAANPEGVRGIVGIMSRLAGSGRRYSIYEVTDWIKANPELTKKVKGRYFLP